MTTNRLAGELRKQLDSDILHYLWIMQVAREILGVEPENDDKNEELIKNTVCDGIEMLLQDGEAEIGNAYEDAEAKMVKLRAWAGSLDEIMIQVRDDLERLGFFDDSYEGFWLGKKQSTRTVHITP